MTHDELLAYINKEIDQAAWTTEYYPFKSLQSLRAVMELHQPSPKDYKNEIGCVGCDINSEWATWNEEWPCPTIQAIEKELG